MGRFRGDELGLDQAITRRDFVNVAGAGLAASTLFA